jgi:F-type H+-transporting ATPase subunit b
VVSAFPLDEGERSQLRATLGRLLAAEPEALEVAIDPELLAGVRISFGAYVLHANLKDELRFFARGYA